MNGVFPSDIFVEKKKNEWINVHYKHISTLVNSWGFINNGRAKRKNVL